MARRLACSGLRRVWWSPPRSWYSVVVESACVSANSVPEQILGEERGVSEGIWECICVARALRVAYMEFAKSTTYWFGSGGLDVFSQAATPRNKRWHGSC
jgi:hypothetical protein